MRLTLSHFTLLFCIVFSLPLHAEKIVVDGVPGSVTTPLRVMLVPTDGGTESGTKADFEPIFNAVSKTSGLHFELRVGQSYAAVAEGMVAGLVDIAFVGPTLYLTIAKRGAAEPLAVAVLNGESVYYAGFFANPKNSITSLDDLRGKSMAFGDVNSSSSFTIQIGMLLSAGIDPVHDLNKVMLTGSHANSLNALAQGHVEFAAASFNSYQKALDNDVLTQDEVVPVARSLPIPYPPFIMSPSLPNEVKNLLRDSFDRVHENKEITPEMIRGFGGIIVDRYSSKITHETFASVQDMLDLVTPIVKGDLLKKSANN